MKELVRWDCCGQGRTEQYICDSIVDYEEESEGTGAIGALDGWELEGLLIMKEEDSSKPYALSEAIWPTREYYIYYNYHPSGGYKTKITGVDRNGQVDIKIIQSEGLSLSAFWSEVVIFRK